MPPDNVEAPAEVLQVQGRGAQEDVEACTNDQHEHCLRSCDRNATQSNA